LSKTRLLHYPDHTRLPFEDDRAIFGSIVARFENGAPQSSSLFLADESSLLLDGT